MPSGVIKINPAVFSDGRAALAVAWNEGLRLWMEDHGYVPVSAPTDEQRQALADTAYADDPEAMAKTVLARIITRDESAPNPTPEQLDEAYDLLLQVVDSLSDDDPDVETVMMLANDFAPEEQDDLPELPEEELSGEEMPEEGVPVPEGELPLAPVEGEMPLPAPEMAQEGAIPEGAPDVLVPEGAIPEGAAGSPDQEPVPAPVEQGVQSADMGGMVMNDPQMGQVKATLAKSAKTAVQAFREKYGRDPETDGEISEAEDLGGVPEPFRTNGDPISDDEHASRVIRWLSKSKLTLDDVLTGAAEEQGGMPGEVDSELPLQSADGGGFVTPRIRTVWVDGSGEAARKAAGMRYLTPERDRETMDQAAEKAFSDAAAAQARVDKTVLPWQRSTQLVHGIDVIGHRRRLTDESGNDIGTDSTVRATIAGPKPKHGWMVRAKDKIVGAKDAAVDLTRRSIDSVEDVVRSKLDEVPTWEELKAAPGDLARAAKASEQRLREAPGRAAAARFGAMERAAGIGDTGLEAISGGRVFKTDGTSRPVTDSDFRDVAAVNKEIGLSDAASYRMSFTKGIQILDKDTKKYRNATDSEKADARSEWAFGQNLKNEGL